MIRIVVILLMLAHALPLLSQVPDARRKDFWDLAREALSETADEFNAPVLKLYPVSTDSVRWYTPVRSRQRLKDKNSHVAKSLYSLDPLDTVHNTKVLKIDAYLIYYGLKQAGLIDSIADQVPGGGGGGGDADGVVTGVGVNTEAKTLTIQRSEGLADIVVNLSGIVFSGDYDDLSNLPDFTGWDMLAADDYSSTDFDTDFTTKTTDDLAEGVSNLYDQTVSLTGAGSVSTSGTYPNFTITGTDSVNDADSDPANELNSTLVLNGTNLELTDAGGTLIRDLSPLQDGTGTDDQDLSHSILDDSLTIEITGGAATTIDLSPYKDDQTVVLNTDALFEVTGTYPTFNLGFDDAVGSDGQVIKKIGGVWTFGTDNVAGGGSADGYLQGVTTSAPSTFVREFDFDLETASDVLDITISLEDDLSLFDNTTSLFINEAGSRYPTTFNLNGTTLEMTGVNGFVQVDQDLSALQDGTGTDDQALGWTQSTGIATLTDGGTFTVLPFDGTVRGLVPDGTNNAALFLDGSGNFSTPNYIADTDTKMQASFDGGGLNEMTSISFNTDDFNNIGTATAAVLEVNFPANNDNSSTNEGSLTTSLEGANLAAINSNTSGSTPVSILGTNGLLITETANQISFSGANFLQSEVDGLTTNEGSLTVGAGGATSSTIASNTSGSTDVTISVTGGLAISEASNTITLDASGIAGESTADGAGTTINADAVDVDVKNSIVIDSDFLQLVNDANTPGNDKYYGTNVGGTKGWFDLPVNTDAQGFGVTDNTTNVLLDLSGTASDFTLAEGSNVTLDVAGSVVTINSTGAADDWGNGNFTFIGDVNTGSGSQTVNEGEEITFSADVSASQVFGYWAQSGDNLELVAQSNSGISNVDYIPVYDENESALVKGVLGTGLAFDRGTNTLSATGSADQNLGWTQSTGILTLTNSTPASITIDPFAGVAQGLVPTGSSNDAALFLDGQGNWSTPNYTVDTDTRTDVDVNGTEITADATAINFSTNFTGTQDVTEADIDLSNTGVGAGVYGSTTSVPQITIDNKGRITNSVNTAIVFPDNNDNDSGNELQTLSDAVQGTGGRVTLSDGGGDFDIVGTAVTYTSGVFTIDNDGFEQNTDGFFDATNNNTDIAISEANVTSDLTYDVDENSIIIDADRAAAGGTMTPLQVIGDFASTGGATEFVIQSNAVTGANSEIIISSISNLTLHPSNEIAANGVLTIKSGKDAGGTTELSLSDPSGNYEIKNMGAASGTTKTALTLDVSDNLEFKNLDISEAVQNLNIIGSAAATQAVDFSNATQGVWRINCSGQSAVTITVSNVPTSGVYVFDLINVGAGTDITLPAGFDERDSNTDLGTFSIDNDLSISFRKYSDGIYKTNYQP